jgi:hypothetical protein
MQSRKGIKGFWTGSQTGLFHLLTNGLVTESAGGVDAGERTKSKAAGEGEEEILEGVGNDEFVLLDVASINDGEVIGG